MGDCRVACDARECERGRGGEVGLCLDELGMARG